MKANYFMAAMAAFTMALFVASCDEDQSPDTYLDGLKVSSSYPSIPLDGGSASVDITANADWVITCHDTCEVFCVDHVVSKKATKLNDWLTISAVRGNAGKTTVNFSAEKALDGHTAELLIKSAGLVQRINVIQGLSVVSSATCAEVIAGPDSKNYRVTGVVTSIVNTTYGNFYLSDGTGEVYIYGTLYDGKEKNDPIAKNNIEVGDQVTVEGPKTTYGSTIELVNVSVVNVSKSLIKCDSLTVAGVVTNELPLEGGEIVAHLTNKGNGLYVDVPTDAQSWLSIASVAGNTVTFKVEANQGGDRKTTLVFRTTDGKKDYSTQAELVQKGAVVACSVSEFLAKEIGDNQYRLKGTITEISGKNYYISDFSGKTLVYNPNLSGNTVKVGDIITVVGKRAAYKENPQMGSPVVEEVTPVTTIDLAAFKALEDNKTAYYLLTGKVSKPTEANTKFDLETYGNFSLTDESGAEVYVYGVSTGVGGESKKFGTLGIKEGDTLTIIAYKTSYTKNDFTLMQAGGAMYVSHTAAE